MSPDRARHLAIHGGAPVRGDFLPYGRQSISEADLAAVGEALRSDWLTTGPKVGEFEEAVAAAVGAREAVAVSSGTAALHAAVHALGIGPGDEVLVPALTFAASANCVVFENAIPVFVDVDPETLLIDPDDARANVTSRTRAVVAVDFAGQPCEYDRLAEVGSPHGLAILADGCHSLGATYRGRPVGSLARMTAFSLHPVKAITAGEGGLVATDDAELARTMRSFRNHGFDVDHRARQSKGSFYYEMRTLGYNYRLTDLQCALGLSQLARLREWTERRQALARRYDEKLRGLEGVRPLATRPEVDSACHLYVVRLESASLTVDRDTVFSALRAENIGVQVHYLPVHLHPFYRERFGTGPGLCPHAEEAYADILSLPLFPAMADSDVDDVATAVAKVLDAYRSVA